jgi:hypothetical protein
MSRKTMLYYFDRVYYFGVWSHYRAVLAFPLRDPEGNVIAGVSVKSVRPHHFDNETETIYAALQPGLLLLGLALECRARLRSFGEMELGEC